MNTEEIIQKCNESGLTVIFSGRDYLRNCNVPIMIVNEGYEVSKTEHNVRTVSGDSLTALYETAKQRGWIK